MKAADRFSARSSHINRQLSCRPQALRAAITPSPLRSDHVMLPAVLHSKGVEDDLKITNFVLKAEQKVGLPKTKFL